MKAAKVAGTCINELLILIRKQNTLAINKLKTDGQIVTSPENIANEFNKYFNLRDWT